MAGRLPESVDQRVHNIMHLKILTTVLIIHWLAYYSNGSRDGHERRATSADGHNYRIDTT